MAIANAFVTNTNYRIVMPFITLPDELVYQTTHREINVQIFYENLTNILAKSRSRLKLHVYKRKSNVLLFLFYFLY